jgi:F-type H+-transporting ATPase subunit gamma
VTERLRETIRRIENVRQLESVVTAMRGIAASRAQQAHSLQPALHAHSSVIARAIGQALLLVSDWRLPANGAAHRTATILFCAEQGFVGAFSERMMDALETGTQRDVFLIGTHGVLLAEQRRIPLVWHAAMVQHANLIAALAQRAADALNGWILTGAGQRVELIVPRWSAGEGVIAEHRSLLPFDFRRFAISTREPPPLTTLPSRMLLARLAEEYVFAELCQAALTAFAAENEARVAAMRQAKSNLHNMLADLQTVERQVRQEEVTAEVVELASGAGARARSETT